MLYTLKRFTVNVNAVNVEGFKCIALITLIAKEQHTEIRFSDVSHGKEL